MGRYYETFPPPYFPYRIIENQTLKLNHNAYERDDCMVELDMKRKLDILSVIDSSAIAFSCDQGWVTLRGFVSTEIEQHFLSRLAENVLGVRGVKNLLKIKKIGASSEDLVVDDLYIPTTQHLDIQIEN